MLQELDFLEKENLITRDFYDYYREHRKKVCEPIDQYKLFEKAVAGLLSTLVRQTIETEGGVYIKGWGYFCHVKNKVKHSIKTKSFFDRQKKDYGYTYWFFPDKFFEGWHIHSNYVYNGIRLKSYKLHFDGIKSYYDAKFLADNLRKYHGKQIKF